MRDQREAQLSELLERLARVRAADGWRDDLNPVQRAALAYLARANRFSRSPSQIADYLMTTRGTVSQTLKSLARRGLVKERPREADKRSITYELTPAGRTQLDGQTAIDRAIGGLSDAELYGLTASIERLLQDALRWREERTFGVCRTCWHHVPAQEGERDGRAWCRLLSVPLGVEEATQICHEHARIEGSRDRAPAR